MLEFRNEERNADIITTHKIGDNIEIHINGNLFLSLKPGGNYTLWEQCKDERTHGKWK